MYHFSDLPEFVSGDHMVVLDPHSAYLPGRKKGTKIHFQKLQLLDRFPDTTAPFLHFGCTMREHYPGTLFRFPLRSAPHSQASCRPNPAGAVLVLVHRWLQASASSACCRTDETAQKSEIKQIAYTPAAVMELFQAFRAEVAKTLIFLKVVALGLPRSAGKMACRVIIADKHGLCVQNVQKISIYTRAAQAEADPDLLFESSLVPEVSHCSGVSDAN